MRKDKICTAHKKRLFVDMDGVLAKWIENEPFEAVCEPGYFLNLPPNICVVDAVKALCESVDRRGTEVYILSAVLDNGHAEREKRMWLDTYCPFIPEKHRLFVSCDERKSTAVGSVSKSDFLLDDYTKNLREWKDEGGTPIKLFNGVNGRSGSYVGAYTCAWLAPQQIVADIQRFMEE